MSDCILKCPKCGTRQVIDAHVYEGYMQLKELSEHDSSIFNRVHPLTCGVCSEELEVWLPYHPLMKYGFGYDINIYDGNKMLP